MSHGALVCGVEGGVSRVQATALARPRAACVAKINGNIPGNPARGLPTIRGMAAQLDSAGIAIENAAPLLEAFRHAGGPVPP